MRRVAVRSSFTPRNQGGFMRHVLVQAAVRLAGAGGAGLAVAASGLSLDPAPAIIHARFDPDAKVVPMPNDALRDAVAGHLDIPIDDTLTGAERALYERLNEMDGWSTAMAATVSF